MTQVVELYVVMYCEACATSVKRAVKKIPGVETYKIDFYGQKVIVVGNVDRDDVWRRIHKTGRHVMLIADPAPPQPKKVEKKEEKKKEKKEERKEETKSEEKTEVKVEEQKTEETKIVETEEEVKVEKVVTVVETKKKEEKHEEPKVEEKREETKAEVRKEKKEPERPKEPEWVPMFVTAPYYTLPSRFYNY